MSLLAPARSIVRRALRPLGLDLVRTHTTMEGHLGRLLASLNVNVVFDVGAHYGEYAALLRTIGYHGRVISFEPVSDSYARLARARRRDAAWTGMQMALGEDQAEAQINVTAATDLSSFLTPNAQSRAWNFPSRIVRTETVALDRLDEVLPRLSLGDAARVFLKLDTQGFDLSVLRGAKRSMDSIVGIQTEIAMSPLYEGMPLFPANVQPFLDLGYEITGMFAVARPDGVAAIEYDCFMRRVDKFITWNSGRSGREAAQPSVEQSGSTDK